MAKIEGVRVLKTLKTRDRIYRLGEVVMAPLPDPLKSELAAKTDTLEIIESQPAPKAAPVKKAEPENG
jgi:hypothetical protein